MNEGGHHVWPHKPSTIPESMLGPKTERHGSGWLPNVVGRIVCCEAHTPRWAARKKRPHPMHRATSRCVAIAIGKYTRSQDRRYGRSKQESVGVDHRESRDATSAKFGAPNCWVRSPRQHRHGDHCKVPQAALDQALRFGMAMEISDFSCGAWGARLLFLGVACQCVVVHDLGAATDGTPSWCTIAWKHAMAWHVSRRCSQGYIA